MNDERERERERDIIRALWERVCEDLRSRPLAPQDAGEVFKELFRLAMARA